MITVSLDSAQDLSTSDTNSFRDAFNGEIIFIASFVPVFHQQYFSVFI